MDVNRLRKDINKKLNNWDERSQFTLAGVKNLSLSDMETLLIFCDEYENSGSLSGFFINENEEKILKEYGWREE